ncbi:hypothetical protein GC174_01280 [bacterium]|nr:hypothetical protein [bacterium]
MTSPKQFPNDFPKPAPECGLSRCSAFDRNTFLSLILILFPCLAADVFILSRMAPYMVLNAPQLTDAVLGGCSAPLISCLVLLTMAVVRDQWFSHLVAISTAVLKIAMVSLLTYSLTSPEPIFLIETGVHLVEAFFYSFVVLVAAVLNLFRDRLNNAIGAFLVMASLESVKTFFLVLISNHDYSLPFDYPMMASLLLYGLCLVALISIKPGEGEDSNPIFLDDSPPPLQLNALFTVSSTLLWTPFALCLLLSASSDINGDLIMLALVLQSAALSGALVEALTALPLPGLKIKAPEPEQLVLTLLPCLLALALSRWLILTTVALVPIGFLCGMAATASLNGLVKNKNRSATALNACLAIALLASFLLATVLSETALVMAAPFVFKPLAIVSFAILSLTAFIDPGPRFLILNTLARIFLTGTGRKKTLTESLAAVETGPVTILSELGFLSTLLMSLYLRYPLLVLSDDGFLNLPPVKTLLDYLNVKIAGKQALESMIFQPPGKMLLFIERGDRELEKKWRQHFKSDYILGRARDTSNGGRKRSYILDAARLETPENKAEEATVIVK